MRQVQQRRLCHEFPKHVGKTAKNKYPRFLLTRPISVEISGIFLRVRLAPWLFPTMRTTRVDAPRVILNLFPPMHKNRSKRCTVVGHERATHAMSIQRVLGRSIYRGPIPHHYMTFLAELKRQKQSASVSVEKIRHKIEADVDRLVDVALAEIAIGPVHLVRQTTRLVCAMGTAKRADKRYVYAGGVAREASGYRVCSSAPTRWIKASSGTCNCGAMEVKRGFLARDRKTRAKGRYRRIFVQDVGRN